MIQPWGSDGLDLLRALLCDPVMMEHLGGPEDEPAIRRRQSRYEQPNSGQFRIMAEQAGRWIGVGWVGYWEREWRGQQVYETGWGVVPAFQGRGLAAQATSELLAGLTPVAEHRYVHAYPSVDNGPSNAICRRAGFELLGPLEFEYPKGSWMHCNDWRFDLRPA